MRKLNERQRAFALAYSDPSAPTFGNAYQSALEAGYAETTALTHAPARLLEDSRIRAIIDEERQKHAQRASVTPDEVIAELSRVCTAEAGSGGVRVSDKVQAAAHLARIFGMMDKREEKHLHLHDRLAEVPTDQLLAMYAETAPELEAESEANLEGS